MGTGWRVEFDAGIGANVTGESVQDDVQSSQLAEFTAMQ